MVKAKKIKKQTHHVDPKRAETKVLKTKKTAKPKIAEEVKEELKIEEPVQQIQEEGSESKKKLEYLFGVGRRKTSIAQVKVFKKGEGKLMVNGKGIKEYFRALDLQERIFSPFKIVGQVDKLNLTAKVQGGGMYSQAEAVRHGISRALLLLNPNFRKPLKKAGFLTRDPRRKERKKPGLKRARKAPQWQKR